MVWNDRAKRDGLAMLDFWSKIWVAKEWHSHARGHGQAVPKFCFGFFVEFLGCVLVGDYVFAILSSFVKKSNEGCF